MATKFSINANITIDPPEVKTDVEEACSKLFGNERGTDETPEEFLNRRVVEWIYSWYSIEKANAAANTASQAVQVQLKEDATLPRRKDKQPEPTPEPASK